MAKLKVLFSKNKKTAGVLFLGSPLKGTKAAKFAHWKTYATVLLGREISITLIKNLEENSDRLNDMVEEFAKLIIPWGLEIRCFYETRKTNLSNAIIRSRVMPRREITVRIPGFLQLTLHSMVF